MSTNPQSIQTTREQTETAPPTEGRMAQPRPRFPPTARATPGLDSEPTSAAVDDPAEPATDAGTAAAPATFDAGCGRRLPNLVDDENRWMAD